MELYCPRCKEEKPSDQFYSNLHRKHGKSIYCIPCSNSYLKERREKKRQEQLTPCHVCGFVPFAKSQIPAQASGLSMCRNCSAMARTPRWDAYISWLAGRTLPDTDIPDTPTPTEDEF